MLKIYQELGGISMKKAVVIGISCFMVFSAGIPTFAAETQNTCKIGNCNVGECFLDEDGDGMCDHYDHCFVDENGDGICDNHCYIDENADGICDYFVDEDTDGICDHCHEHNKPEQTYCAPQTTTPQRYGHHSSHHGHGRHHGGCHY